MSSAVIFQLTEDALVPVQGIPLSDRGFRFGQHVFETVAVVNYRWLFWKEHLKLLTASAALCGFSAADEMLKRLTDLPAQCLFEEGIVRVFWTAGDGAPGTAPSEGRIYCLCEPSRIPGCENFFQIAPEPAIVHEVFPGAKTGNYWARSDYLARVRKLGFDEQICLNPEGRVLGVCTGNLFVCFDGGWFTPGTADGARNGVVRAWVLNRGFAREASIDCKELQGASEFLVTNSRIGICRAAWLQQAGTEAAAGPSDSACELLNAYQKLLKGDVKT